jgi:Electron transfer DM13
VSTARLVPRRSRGLVAAPVVAAVVLFGVWVTGGAISDDFRTAMALTAAWFVLSAAGSLVVARRLPAIRIAVLASYAVTAAAVGGYLGLTTLRERVVHERVVTAAAAVAGARFQSREHETTGMATVVRLPDGRRFLTLTAFATSPGPDLRVRLTPGASTDGGAAGAVDLGGLKGNRGDQQYAIPSRVRTAGRTVLIWCRAFTAAFGSARLPG